MKFKNYLINESNPEKRNTTGPYGKLYPGNYGTTYRIQYNPYDVNKRNEKNKNKKKYKNFVENLKKKNKNKKYLKKVKNMPKWYHPTIPSSIKWSIDDGGNGPQSIGSI